MGKKSGITFPALQGLVGLFALLIALWRPFQPEVFAGALALLCLHCFLPLAVSLALRRRL